MPHTFDNYSVTDKKSFIAFLDLLRKDLAENPAGWENKTLPGFLEALSAYCEDIQGYYDNAHQPIDADQPAWATFADIFKGARVYE